MNNGFKAGRFASAILVSAGGALLPASASAADLYTFATPNCTLSANSWCLGGPAMTGFISAVNDPSNFGPGGTVDTSIQISELGAVDAGTLAGADGFISSWWSDEQSEPPAVSAVIDFLMGGGDLILFQDDFNHDDIGAALGLPSLLSDGSVSNGVSPLFVGPFGAASDVAQAGATGYLSAASVASAGGSIGGLNAGGQITSAYWAEGQFAPGAGKLVIIADVDMASNNTATYFPANANGRFTLNSVAYAISAPVPEPATWMMMIGGFGLAGGALRYRSRGSKVLVA